MGDCKKSSKKETGQKCSKNRPFILKRQSSWNFSHIVKLKAMRAVKKVNADGLWKPLERVDKLI
ncbi:hypothetical protein FACS1894139_18150 [Planctomycetales bacterium]|nr:hypothetical protein FACS1894139_18150 [Planctomycetales bacterium]